jgi:TPR repeat protein
MEATVKRMNAIVFAVAAMGVAASAMATDEAFERMTYRDYVLMLRDAHLAYQRDDHAKAFELYARNACAGDKNSQFALGSMYLYGEGTGADGMKAYAWIATAAEAEEPRFRNLYEKLAKAIPKEHLAAAKEAAEATRKQYGEHATKNYCAMRAEAGTKITELECKPPIDIRTGYVEVKRCDA